MIQFRPVLHYIRHEDAKKKTNKQTTKSRAKIDSISKWSRQSSSPVNENPESKPNQTPMIASSTDLSESIESNERTPWSRLVAKLKLSQVAKLISSVNKNAIVPLSGQVET